MSIGMFDWDLSDKLRHPVAASIVRRTNYTALQTRATTAATGSNLPLSAAFIHGTKIRQHGRARRWDAIAAEGACFATSAV